MQCAQQRNVPSNWKNKQKQKWLINVKEIISVQERKMMGAGEKQEK